MVHQHRRWTEGSSRFLALITLGTMITTLSRLVVSPLLPDIIETLDISSSEAGAALTVMWALYALGQYPSGRFSDELTRKTVLLASLFTVMIGIALLLRPLTYGAFLIGTGVIGLGAGMYPPVAYSYISDRYEAKRGEAFGVNTAGVYLGGVLAAVLSVVAMSVGEWQIAFVPILGSAAFVFYLFYSSDSGEVLRPTWVKFEFVETFSRLLGIGQTRRLLLALALSAFVWQGTVSFLPTYLLVDKAVSPSTATNAFAGLFIVGMITNPVAGGLGDRYGHLSIAIGTGALASGGLGITIVAATEGVLAVGLTLFGGGLAGFFPLVFTSLTDRFPDANVGGDLGASRTLYIGLGSLGPGFVGLVSEEVNYTVALSFLVACLLLALIVMLNLTRTR